MAEFQGKSVLVLGGSRGIRAAIVMFWLSKKRALTLVQDTPDPGMLQGA